MIRSVILLFVFAVSTGALAADDGEHLWSRATREDLQAVYDILEANHPGPVDPENPGYREWLEQGLADGLETAKTIDSFNGYYFTLRRYMDGFDDGHLGGVAKILPTSWPWPGFLFNRRGADTLVAVSRLDDDSVRAGDRLVSCGGKTPDELMEIYVLPYKGISGLEAETARLTPTLFNDLENPFATPPETCTFQRGDTSFEHALGFRNIGADEIQTLRKEAGGIERDEIGLEQLPNDVYWLSLSSFGSSDEMVVRLEALLEQVESNSDALRHASAIVFDVRGNDGGNSGWGTEVLQTIWGDDILDKLQRTRFDRVDWRASPGNIDALNFYLDRVIRQRGEEDEFVGYYRRLIGQLEAARAAGETFAPRHPTQRTEAFEPSEIEPRIILLTSHSCFSACLDMADSVLSLPGAVHAGLPTRADAVYIDNYSQMLPSNVMRFSYSMKVYRGRARGHNEPYLPARRIDVYSLSEDDIRAQVLGLLE